MRQHLQLFLLRWKVYQGMDKHPAKFLHCNAFQTAKVWNEEQLTGHLTKPQMQKAGKCVGKCFHTHFPSKNRIYGNSIFCHLDWKRNGKGVLFTVSTK